MKNTILKPAISATAIGRKPAEKIALSAGLCKKKENYNITNPFKISTLTTST